MEFSEAGGEWREVPDWVRFLITFGYRWPAAAGIHRRIAVVSMPCDSAAAGLVALGVMRRCLEMDDADDIRAHHKRLLELAQQLGDRLELRHKERWGVYKFDGFYDNGDPRVRRKKSSQDERHSIPVSSALDWFIKNESPIVLPEGEQVPCAQLYSHLMPNWGEIRPLNLSVSHSEVCLVGRSKGESATKRSVEAVRFREGDLETGLSGLLTIQSWMPNTISRVNFYNSRTKKFDRNYIKPRIAIADGDRSLLGVLDRKDFGESDVIGVIDRSVERDRLESIGNKLADLRQWYNKSILSGLPEVPRGMGIFIMERRSA